VRIFIGTESGQHRAERVLLWSIEQVRDPSRAYEIHLMKDLVGFDRRRWLTGFTNYRFAIPQLAGGTGRAIYNDVDQIYLVDPAELFDLDMEGHGFLSIRETDTSVMLIDCERMASVWTVDLVRSGKRKSIEARATAVPGLWGPLDPHWNARDEEYVPGRTSVLHFTTIHTQPWHPFPQHFVYQHNPVAEVWHELERGADAAGYRVFGAAHPSRRYGELLERLRVAPDARGDLPPEGLEEVLREVDARTLLDVGLGRPSNATATPGACEDANGRSVTRWDPVYPDLAKPPQESFDAVVCPAALDLVPDEDAGWFVEELFRHARRLVVAGVRREPAPEVLADGSEVRSPPREESWWLARFEEAAARHPDVRWRVVLRRRGALGRERVRTRDGGPPPGRVPRVWVLTDDKAGHTTQSLGLAEAVGWPYEVKELRFRALNRLSNSLLSATRLGLDRRRSSRLEPPWPEVVIATGRRTAPVARWIARQSPGRTRLVQIGRKGGDVADRFDLVVTCAHFRLPLHPRRMEIVVPLNAVTPERLELEAARHEALFDERERPRVALLVGGSSARHRLDAATARRMGAEVAVFARAAGGSVLAITSPRTGSEATEALAEGLGSHSLLHRWRRGEEENPYLAFLGAADAIVVTGDSESMLGEAVAAAKPVYVYPVPERRPGLRLRLCEWVMERAAARPRKRNKGTVRPQQGLEYLCARLVERAIVRPPRDLSKLYRGLFDLGVARPFGAALDCAPPPPLREIDDVARRVRGLVVAGSETDEPAGRAP
jgi:mitochondrial fission protein ELM1